MKVSIIITTYNRESYICQAIESVLNQTMDDIEIIVVDDGSTDGTRKQLLTYGDKIKYIYSENGGPARARNIGMKAASGEYISFLDSDDLYYPYKTEIESQFLDRFAKIGMVYTEFSGFDDSGYWDEFHLRKYHIAYQDPSLTYESIFPESLSLKESGLNIRGWSHKKIYFGNIVDSVFKQIIVNSNSMMIRKSLLEVVGLQNEKYNLFEDLDFIIRICKCFEVGFIDVPTYKLRYHDHQISNTSKENGLDIVIKKQENLIEIYEKYGLNDREFYLRNKAMVQRRLAVLHKALVIPLLAKGGRIQDVRSHLEQCRNLGYPEPMFWLLTYCPYFVQRIVLKIINLSGRFS